MSEDIYAETPITGPFSSPLHLDGMPLAEEGDPNETAEKAKRDRKVGSAVQFINFPQDIPEEAHTKLVEYEKAVSNYRSWACLRWWNTTYATDSVPQDESAESAAKRMSYCAQVAGYDVQNTPWLTIFDCETKSKTITFTIDTFATVFFDVIVEGLACLPANSDDLLEKVFKGINTAMETRLNDKPSVQQCIISQRYGYHPDQKSIWSIVRISTFEIYIDELTSLAFEEKNSSVTIETTVEYNEYQAEFKMDDWITASNSIEEWKQKTMEEFVGDATVEVPTVGISF
ncbi:predicted protein [Sclerotinia sclerotiorum 1980 UF-70]|uniref:Uncharacterized protein n=2 Tax=Sclerotinia sclerotiorum (strain ATCC 18683 / 1980 / Ss-1) TaxID=665079 RepID=A7EDM2_SCLS1|nr:predicted protein [Sclerotinia sclerotiorum 1980 UF-70]APA10907.1 hypothetical protein sscle_07g056770 [Sclerotinia sclerotiorum 1980 UF-70]EDO00938.1 predicted protein [Sclerotinia sclerotiorum 1980 UF-70]